MREFLPRILKRGVISVIIVRLGPQIIIMDSIIDFMINALENILMLKFYQKSFQHVAKTTKA